MTKKTVSRNRIVDDTCGEASQPAVYGLDLNAQGVGDGGHALTVVSTSDHAGALDGPVGLPARLRQPLDGDALRVGRGMKHERMRHARNSWMPQHYHDKLPDAPFSRASINFMDRFFAPVTNVLRRESALIDRVLQLTAGSDMFSSFISETFPHDFHETFQII